MYLTMQGEITFPNKAALDAAVETLTAGHWMKEGKMVDECGNAYADCPSVDGLTIQFPYGLYRNIGIVIDRMVPGTEGLIAWTTTDGVFSGGIIEDGKETTYDLWEWARKDADLKDRIATDEAGMKAMMDGEPEEFANLMAEIEAGFMDEFI
jgi:hypothetical protein